MFLIKSIVIQINNGFLYGSINHIGNTRQVFNIVSVIL